MSGKSKSISKKAQESAQEKTSMSFCDAAEAILLKERKPLSYRVLAKKAVKQGLLATESQTPEISMHVSIRTEMNRREKRGEPQRFVFLGEGLFSHVDLLLAPPTAKARDALDQVRDSRKEACEKLYAQLTNKNQGPNFEIMVSELLTAIDYKEVTVIGGKDDQGVDIICEKRDGIMTTRIAIQCKCKALKSKIGPKDVSTLRDNLSSYQCQYGILVTTSELNEDAKKKAKEAGKEPIHFIEHDEILDLFAEHGIGIRNESLKFYQVDFGRYDFLK